MKGHVFAVAGALAVFVLGMSVSNCADNEPPPRAPRADRALANVGVFITVNGEADKLQAALADQLVRAGFRVGATADEPHDVAVEITASQREKSSLLHVTVNGQEKKSVVIEAAVAVKGGREILGSSRIEYDADDGPSDEDVGAVVNALGSPAVRRYVADARKRREHEAAEQREQKDDLAEAEQDKLLQKRKTEREHEEKVWASIVLSECSAPTQLTACDAVKQYLAEFPTGRHAADAKKALETGTPALARLGDERDWRVARPEACKAPKGATDCDGVTSYLAAQPAGAHVDEARALLRQAEPKLAAIRKEDDRRAKEQEAKADREIKNMEEEEKRKAREQCKKDCIGNVCFSLKPGKFEICVDRCVKANCD